MSFPALLFVSAAFASEAENASPPPAGGAVAIIALLFVLVGLVSLPLGLIAPRLIPGSRGTRPRAAMISLATIFFSFGVMSFGITGSAPPKSSDVAQTATAAPPLSQPAETPKPVANAAPPQETHLRTIAAGAPFCGTQDQLGLYLLAAYNNDRDTVNSLTAVLNAIESQSRALGRDFRILGATERLGLHERDWQRRAYAIRKEACGR